MWTTTLKAYYFQQAQNGLYAREAILCDVLGITLDDVKKEMSIGEVYDMVLFREPMRKTRIAGGRIGKRHCYRPYTF